MKFKKKSKVMIAITAIFTVAVCVCFFVTGAYAAPSADSKEKNLTPNTAPNVESNRGYTYVQRSFYSDSYIIEMGWNLSDTISKEYANSKEITLEDNSVIKVYFDENTVDYLNDSNAISAIGKLLYSLNNGDMQNYPTIEVPLITNVTYVSENLSILVEEYFQNSRLTEFSAIFPVLDTELQKEYYQKIYDDNKIAFFSAIIPYMDRDLVILYVDKAIHDQKVNFFSVILGYMQSDDLNQYAAEKCYEANNVSYFTVLVYYMTKEEKQEWIKRAQTDKKTNFVAVLSD